MTVWVVLVEVDGEPSKASVFRTKRAALDSLMAMFGDYGLHELESEIAEMLLSDADREEYEGDDISFVVEKHEVV